VFNFVGGREDLSNFTGQPELQLECTHTNQIMSLYLSVKGDHVLVGDLVRSSTLLRYKPAEKALQEVARDFNSSYLRAVEILDAGPGEEIYVGADINGNLQCLRHVADAVSDEDRCRLEACGEFHVGEYINAFRRGTLVGQPIDAESSGGGDGAASGARAGAKEAVGGVLGRNYASVTGLKAGTSSVLYGGVSGAIGNIISLSEDSHRFFSAVERVMKRAVTSIGGLNHREWRSFQNDVRTAPQRCMVDGDLVEMLLEVDRQLLEGLVREINDEVNAATATMNAASSGGLKANGTSTVTTSSTGSMLLNLANERIELSVEDVLHRVEDISRLH
jgi:DNA damage-binding protein 1